MSTRHEMEAEKTRELTQMVVNSCASIGTPLEEQDAAKLVSSYADINAPVYREPTGRKQHDSEMTMVRGQSVVRVVQVKAGNIELHMDDLIIALSGAGLAIAVAPMTPLLAVLAMLYVVANLKKLATVKLTEIEASVVLTLRE